MQQGRTIHHVAGIVCVICGFTAGSVGRQAGHQQDAPVIAWFDRAWSEAQRFPAFQGVSIAWRIEDWETMPPEKLAILKREAATHPEHPLRDDIPRLEKHAAGTPTVMRHELFCRGARDWRFNTTFDDGSYNDAVLGGGNAWWHSNEVLKLLDTAAAAEMEDPEQSLVTFEHEFVSPIGKLIHGYLSVGATAGLKPGPVEVRGDAWKTRLSTAAGIPSDQHLALEVTGRWDASLRRGFVERVVITANGYKPETVGRRYEFAEWTDIPALGTWVATRVEEFTPRGVLDRATVFEGARPLPAGGFAAVFAEPSAGRADVVRGEVRPALTSDYRRGTIRETMADGQVRESEMAEGAWSVRRATRERLRWAGWCSIAGVAVLGFAIVRARR
ncbi:MAG: hypothetical protein AMXMBFR58_12540 [Phycisphaerae bacterium]